MDCGPGTVAGMLQTVLERRSRAYYGQRIHPERHRKRSSPLTSGAVKAARAVYYYHTSAPTIAIYATKTVEDWCQRSLARMP